MFDKIFKHQRKLTAQGAAAGEQERQAKLTEYKKDVLEYANQILERYFFNNDEMTVGKLQDILQTMQNHLNSKLLFIKTKNVFKQDELPESPVELKSNVAGKSPQGQ